ncbi:MAG: MFS transporter [Candidatus Eiseniibacteriota bacterium]|nr:MAG: MFS transporter [Candidatus Eisenbacteria bacterium]
MEIDRKTLRYRYFAPLYLANVGEGICLTVVMFFVPLYVRRTFAGTSLLTIASIVAIPGIAMFVASNFWGALADYTKKLRPFLLVGLAGYSGCLLALSKSDSTTSVILTSAVFSLFFAAVRPISQSYVTLLRETEKGRAVGNLMAFQSLGWFIGGAICGYLFEPETGLPVRTILIWGSLLGAVVLAMVALTIKPMPAQWQAGREGHSWLAGLTADLGWLYRSRAVVAICVATALSASGTWLFFGNFSIFLTEYARASTTLLGWAMALSTLLGMFTFTLYGKLTDRVGPVRVFLLAVVLYVAVYALVSATKSPILISVYFCLPVYPAFHVGVTTLVSELAGEKRRAGGLGVLAGVFAFSLAAGTLAGGAVADHSGLGVLPRWTLGFQLASLGAIVVSVRMLRVLSLETGRRDSHGLIVPTSRG